MLSRRQLVQRFAGAAMVRGAGDLWPTLAAAAETGEHRPDLGPAGTRPKAIAVSGYASTSSVAPGNSIDFHLSSESPGPTNLTIERVGTIPVSATITAILPNLSPPTTSPWEGFAWPVAESFGVPSTWPTGLYRLARGSDDLLTFVVRPATPGTVSKVLLQVAFLTPTAYNPAGGKSLYGFNSGPGFDEASRASRVSLDRPGGTAPSNKWEAKLIRWLETERIPIEYCSSVDLHTIPNLLADYECLVIAGHDEYWTKQMRDRVERFVADGGNLIVLSGNTCYRAVRLDQSDRLVVFYKYAGKDPTPNADATVAWADAPESGPERAARRRIHGGRVQRSCDGLHDSVSVALGVRRRLGRHHLAVYDLRN